MPFDGSGNYVRSFNWVTDKANNIDITASRFDTEDNGYATALSNCITRDGQGKPTATINWNNQQITNILAITLNQDPTTALQAATKQYVDFNIQKSGATWGATAGGTANAITVTLTPVPAAYTAGLEVGFIAAAANTGAATLNINSLGAINLVRNDGSALLANDIVTGQECIARYDGAAAVFKLVSAVSSQVPAFAGFFISSAASGGSANAQTIAAPGFTLTAGFAVLFNPGFSNTAAMTVNVNGTGAKNVFRQSAAGAAACNGGEVVAGQLALLVYDGTQFELINNAYVNTITLFISTTASGGSANAQTITTTINFGIQTNKLVLFNPGFTNTGAMTLSANGITAINVLKQSPSGLVALTGGEIQTGQYALVWGDGTQWELLNPITISTANIVQGSALATGKTFLTSGTLSGSSVDISVPTDAQEIEIEIEGLSTSTSATIQVQYKVGGTLVNAASYAQSQLQNSGTSVTGASSTTLTAWQPAPTAAFSGANITMKVQGVQNTLTKGFYSMLVAGTLIDVTAGQCASNTGLISDILLSLSTGTFSAGAYRVYKIK